MLGVLTMMFLACWTVTRRGTSPLSGFFVELWGAGFIWARYGFSLLAEDGPASADMLAGVCEVVYR